MKIILIDDFTNIPKHNEKINLVLGLFDGVHLGHQELINFAKKNSKDEKLGVFTFDKALKNTSSTLMNLSDKENELGKLPIDYLFVLMCNKDIKNVSHETFLNSIIKELNPTKIFCGPDFRFGHKALGDVNYLKSHFGQVYVFDFVEDENGEKISTSLIKELLCDGNVEKANKLLTREYKIRGKVVSGYHNGHVLGFPTANIEPTDSYLLPKSGVYFTKIEFDTKKYLAVTNIGVHPSINKLKNPIIEAHIIDSDVDLYGKEISLFIYKKERDEKQFDDIGSLKKQILLDKENCVKYFSN